MRRQVPTRTNRHGAPAEDSERADGGPQPRDSVTEAIIQEVAEILAKGYLRLAEKRRQAGSECTAVEVEPKPSRPAPTKPRRAEVAPLPPPRMSESRPPIPEEVRAVVAERLGKLSQMNLNDLKAEYEGLFGRPAQTSNRQYLLRRIAWEIQAQVEGRLSKQVRQYACALAEQEELYRRVAENLAKRRADGTAPAKETVPSKPAGRRRGIEKRP